MIRSSLRTLCVQGPFRSCSTTLLANGESMKPSRGVALVFTANHRDAELGSRQQGASDGVCGQWPAVDVQTFDQKMSTIASRLNISELAEESSFGQGEVEVANGLALHQYATSDPVVPRRKPASDDYRSKQFECSTNSPGFVDVYHDGWLSPFSRQDRPRVIAMLASNCAYSSREVRRK